MKHMIVLVFLICIISAKADVLCTTYDDFSGQSLDQQRWAEIDAGLDEHYLDNISHNYHTAELTPADREADLELLQFTFMPGERVEYDLAYNSGDGNRISVIDLDYHTRWWGVVGYWNEDQQGGNGLGTYHFNVTFTASGADVYVTRPDNTTLLMHDFPQSPGTNHTIGFGTRTGHNGIVHMDYDNVKVCKNIQDTDHDGIPDDRDNCLTTPNPSQTDLDRDGIGDWCDNCILHRNQDQHDQNGNGIGDVCEGCSYRFIEFCSYDSVSHQ